MKFPGSKETYCLNKQRGMVIEAMEDSHTTMLINQAEEIRLQVFWDIFFFPTRQATNPLDICGTGWIIILQRIKNFLCG